MWYSSIPSYMTRSSMTHRPPKMKSSITLPRKPSLESLARIRNLARMSARKAIMVEDRPEERQNSLLRPRPNRLRKKAAHLWRSLPKQKRRPSKALQQKKPRKPKPPPASSVRRRTTRVPLRQPLPITPVPGRDRLQGQDLPMDRAPQMLRPRRKPTRP